MGTCEAGAGGRGLHKKAIPKVLEGREFIRLASPG